MRRRLGRTARGIATFAAVAWLFLAVTRTPSVGLYGRGAGAFVRADIFSVSLDVGWGWPSRDWMRRRHRRSPGETAWARQDFLGWGIGSEGRRWNANVPITVTWAGVRLPWWYCAAVALAPVLHRPLRAMTLGRRRAIRRRRYERWRRPACARCGYDLRGSNDFCPECGRAVPGQVLSVRRHDADSV